MKINKLGRTGYDVTVLGLGCYQFTGEFGVTPEVSEKIVNYAMESVINLFDTAQMYGFGESEEIVGRGLYKYPDKKTIISTKVGYLHDRTVSRTLGMEAFQDITAIKRAIKHSLWLLRRDFIEILMIHEPNYNIWWKFNYETGDSVVLTVLEEMKKEGLIGSIGIGGWDLEINAKLVKTGRIDVALSAGGINLLEKPILKELIPEAKKQKVGIIVGGCFGQNNPLLISKDRVAAKKLAHSEDSEEVMRGSKLLKLYDIADELNISMTELAIRYILSFDEIHCHIPGAREVAHLKSNLEAVDKGPLSKNYLTDILNL